MRGRRKYVTANVETVGAPLSLAQSQVDKFCDKGCYPLVAVGAGFSRRVETNTEI